MTGPADSWPRGGYLDSRQMAHALGVTKAQLTYMIDRGEVVPTYKLRGGRGALLFSAAEVRRVLALGEGQRRTFRRRRKVLTRQPMDGLQPYVPKVRVKRTWADRPDQEAV